MVGISGFARYRVQQVSVRGLFVFVFLLVLRLPFDCRLLFIVRLGTHESPVEKKYAYKTRCPTRRFVNPVRLPRRDRSTPPTVSPARAHARLFPADDPERRNENRPYAVIN